MATLDETHFRALENLYHGAPCNKPYRPRLRVAEAFAEVEIEVRPELYHAAHALHGSTYFKVLDDAAFFAVNSLVPDVFVLTAGMHIELLRPVTEGTIRAEGRVLDRSKRRFVAEAVAFNGDDVCARGWGTFMTSKVALDEDVGYRLGATD